ncbi:hypothetical protein [Phenylobacterium zucineum]|uniref:hypothetical protein n=1 Tax=Phenylobacterium zucineum TaxID=284016 RepID=UPI00030E1858|nr:hypothetical protein [Phenylobacterium zucineum]
MREPDPQRSAALRLLIGAALAAALGSSAGAALRPAPAERGGPAAPQQIYLDGVALSAAEQSGGGWPARARS